MTISAWLLAALAARGCRRACRQNTDAYLLAVSLCTCRYSAPFRDDVQSWIVKLSMVSEVIEQWLIVQNMWMYMEAVFSGGDIVKQLPQEAKRFQNIDKNYMKVGGQGAPHTDCLSCSGSVLHATVCFSTAFNRAAAASST